MWTAQPVQRRGPVLEPTGVGRFHRVMLTPTPIYAGDDGEQRAAGSLVGMLEADHPKSRMSDPSAGGRRWAARRSCGLSRRDQSRRHLIVGTTLLVAVAALGLYFAILPDPVVVDRWVLDLVGPSGNGVLTGVTSLRYPQVIVVVSLLLAVVAFPRDRLRSLACLVGPPLALLTCELVAKPLVGRHMGGGLSFPSGSTVGAAALAAAAVLAVPGRWRPVAIVIGLAYSLWMGVAVVALQWHLPTDAVAGMAYGVGVVLVLDGALWMIVAALGARASRRRQAVSGRG